MGIENLRDQFITVLGIGALGASAVTIGAYLVTEGYERWNDMELDRQEGQRVTFTTENTTDTSNLGCVFDEAGNPVIQDVDTGETYSVYEVQGQDGENCYFTDGPHRATGSQVFHAPKLGQ